MKWSDLSPEAALVIVLIVGVAILIAKGEDIKEYFMSTGGS